MLDTARACVSDVLSHSYCAHGPEVFHGVVQSVTQQLSAIRACTTDTGLQNGGTVSLDADHTTEETSQANAMTHETTDTPRKKNKNALEATARNTGSSVSTISMILPGLIFMTSAAMCR